MSISPKLSNATPNGQASPAWRRRHEHTRHVPGVIRQLIEQYTYQFKFVVGQRRDCDEVMQYLDQYPEIDRGRVMLMPLGTSVEQLAAIAAWLEGVCEDLGLRYCPRRQIEWYGLTRGT
jgi:7-carboxy-7-deazaguanine synthase